MKNFIDIKKMAFLKKDKKFVLVVEAIYKNGGVAYLVGGCVRDLILKLPIKDLDIEVHGMDLSRLEKVLGKFGFVKLVGKQFGVLRLDGLDVDWSIPRKDSKGRKPEVKLDPKMGLKEASRRRDLTINGMAIDLNFLLPIRLRPKGGCAQGDRDSLVEILDPWGGIKDLKSKKLRAVDEKLFIEDPLRFFRVMQFIGRFEMEPDKKLNSICKKVSLKGIASERIFEELCKLFLKSKRPSLGIRWLQKIKRLKEVMPEVFDLIGVKQPMKYHPEKDVFEHSMQALDFAANYSDYESDQEKLIIMFAALCHDFGKPKTTDKDFHAFRHEVVGSKIAKKFIKRFTSNILLQKTVGKMVLYHMLPGCFVDQKAGLNAYKRLALKLYPQANLRQLAILGMADCAGRSRRVGFFLKRRDPKFARFIAKAKQAFVENMPEKPILLGRHLLDKVSPGKGMGVILKRAYKIQIEEGIKDLEELKNRVLKNR